MLLMVNQKDDTISIQSNSRRAEALLGNPISLSKESLYLQGARDVLLRLKDDYAMYLVPSVKLKVKEECKDPWSPDYNYFPLPDRTLRKLLGDAMIRCLTMDRESLVKYLQGDHTDIVVTGQEKDKKGKVASITIKIE